MKPDWIGLLFLLGFIAVGTLIMFFVYKIIVAILKRITGRKSRSSAKSPPMTPHIVVVTCIVVGILFVVPIAMMTTTPDRKIGYPGLMIWALLFVVVYMAEKRILRLKSYRESWWCQPLGSRKRIDNGS